MQLAWDHPDPCIRQAHSGRSELACGINSGERELIRWLVRPGGGARLVAAAPQPWCRSWLGSAMLWRLFQKYCGCLSLLLLPSFLEEWCTECLCFSPSLSASSPRMDPVATSSGDEASSARSNCALRLRTSGRPEWWDDWLPPGASSSSASVPGMELRRFRSAFGRLTPPMPSTWLGRRIELLLDALLPPGPRWPGWQGLPSG
mmetsp:Transcript_94184/g.266542  ORF Transcript_94184/g.266542 Transcript_94184/m.266542 type:complete len:203 (+) Transcript_94184:157-765(+)